MNKDIPYRKSTFGIITNDEESFSWSVKPAIKIINGFPGGGW
jgi:hypothetical protein